METDRPTTSPTDDVEYDEDALREADKRMHTGGHGDDKRNADPAGGHDPEALEEGAEHMGADKPGE